MRDGLWGVMQNFTCYEFGWSRTFRSIKSLAFTTLGTLAIGVTPVWAQVAPPVSPTTVTPSTLAPQQGENGYQIEIPETAALQPPAGSEGLTVSLGDATLEGGFPEVRAQTEAVLAGLRARTVSVAEIYAAASRIEAIHARAGYVLARVSVPPQHLANGATLRIVVTDGFIEDVDVSGLPPRVQSPASMRTAGLVGRRHVTIRQIEQSLMIASDIPGLNLRSTLMRGAQPGGAKLVLEGNQRPVSGSLGVDNQLDPSLGRWGVNLQVALNSALGLGEQVYGFAASDYDVTHLFGDGSQARVLGAGVIVPWGDGRLTINPEATFSRTAPRPDAGTPRTEGILRRLSLRINEALVRTRREQAGIGLIVEQIEEANKAPDFGIDISRDRYMAARLGGSWRGQTLSGGDYGMALQLSQGLGDLGSISAAEAANKGVPFSRAGSSTDFTKVVASIDMAWPLGKGFALFADARGQASLGQPMLRAEQFTLEGPDGLSAYVGGVTAVDTGLVARSELSKQLVTGSDPGKITSAAPYVFLAFGSGRLEQPTALEQRNISAYNIGAGLRVTLARRISLATEYVHGISDDPLLAGVDRGNARLAVRF